MESVDIKFVISSHINYYKKTYSYVVDSLLLSGVPKENIYFVVGGCDEIHQIVDGKGINNIKTNLNSFDFTGLISVLDLGIASDYWFSLHDTCYVDPQFYSNVLNTAHTNPNIALTSGKSMNMGSYRWDYLESIKSELSSYKNYSEDPFTLQVVKKKQIDMEDVFLSKVVSYNPQEPDTSGPTDYYKTNTPRIIEHYNQIGLYKIKANWQQKSEYITNI